MASSMYPDLQQLESESRDEKNGGEDPPGTSSGTNPEDIWCNRIRVEVKDIVDVESNVMSGESLDPGKAVCRMMYKRELFDSVFPRESVMVERVWRKCYIRQNDEVVQDKKSLFSKFMERARTDYQRSSQEQSKSRSNKEILLEHIGRSISNILLKKDYNFVDVRKVKEDMEAIFGYSYENPEDLIIKNMKTAQICSAMRGMNLNTKNHAKGLVESMEKVRILDTEQEEVPSPRKLEKFEEEITKSLPEDLELEGLRNISFSKRYPYQVTTVALTRPKEPITNMEEMAARMRPQDNKGKKKRASSSKEDKTEELSLKLEGMKPFSFDTDNDSDEDVFMGHKESMYLNPRYHRVSKKKYLKDTLEGMKRIKRDFKEVEKLKRKEHLEEISRCLSSIQENKKKKRAMRAYSALYNIGAMTEPPDIEDVEVLVGEILDSTVNQLSQAEQRKLQREITHFESYCYN